jgi:UDP-N-acetylmuramoylalanine--D-glutamate ligase
MITSWADIRRTEGGRGSTEAARRLALEGRRVLVVGLQRSGKGAVKLLLEAGCSVTATDLKGEADLDIDARVLRERGVRLVLGEQPESLAADADLVVVSPGVPSGAPVVSAARARGVQVIGELELAYRASAGTWLAVTGTNGKSTTTALLGELAATTGRPTLVAGNIGIALSSEVARVPAGGLIVAEVSSFQLDTIEAFRPRVAVLLNITEDHLDRYDSFEDYAESKRRVFMNQTSEDFAVLNVDDPRVASLDRDLVASVIPVSVTREVRNGVFVRRGSIVSRLGGEEREIVEAARLRIRGPHNLADAVAAVAAASAVGVDPASAARALTGFSPLPHRMEPVAEIDGVLFVNDSKATNVDSVLYALSSYEAPIVLIAGGKDKGADFRRLRDPIRERVKAAILIGEAADSMERALSGETVIERAASLGEAVRAAAAVAGAGDVVLLSPACASFDMFTDFEERGRVFKAEVEALGRAGLRRATP